MNVTDSNFKNEVLESEKPVLVEFWASWCPPCHAMKGVLAKLEKEIIDVKIATMNVDQNPKTSLNYNVRGVPCFMVFKEGKAVFRDVGAKSENQIRHIISENTSLTNS